MHLSVASALSLPLRSPDSFTLCSKGGGMAGEVMGSGLVR